MPIVKAGGVDFDEASDAFLNTRTEALLELVNQALGQPLTGDLLKLGHRPIASTRESA